METRVRLNITSGRPISKTISVTLPTGRLWWLTIGDFEVRSHMREEPDMLSPLVLNLSPYLTPAFVSTDVLEVKLDMDGEDTMLVTRSGWYDIILSDTGTVDDRLMPIVSGDIIRRTLVTTPSGSV